MRVQAGAAPAPRASSIDDDNQRNSRAAPAALKSAGAQVVLRRYPGMIHGFFGWGTWSTAAAAAVTDVCAEFRSLLARVTRTRQRW